MAASLGAPSVQGDGSSGLQMPGAAKFGQHRVQGGAGFRVEQSADFAEPVGALFVQGQMAAVGPRGIRERSVGVQQGQQPVGGLAQPGRPVPDRHLREVGLGGLPRRVIDTVGQLGEEPADDPHLLGADLPGSLGRGGAGRPR